jgi:nitroreductase
VVFTVLPSDDPKVFEQEEIASVAMAIQNFLIGAHARGLGAMLRTGAAAYHPSVGEHLGLAPDEKVVGIVYLGRPEADRSPTERAPAADKTVWLG